jgi:chromosome segregation ATPase
LADCGPESFPIRFVETGTRHAAKDDDEGRRMDAAHASGDLGDLLEARRRILAAFERIASGAENLSAQALRASEIDRLRAELEEERIVNAQLQERVRALRERDTGRAALEDELARARARIAELEAAREAEHQEIDSVLSELIPIVEEAH